jgi:hypothetical protein
MQHRVTVTINTIQQSFPDTFKSDGIKVSLNETNWQLVSNSPYVAIFEDIAPGVYTVTAAAIGNDGLIIGDVISQDLIISPDAILVDIPITMSFNIE